MSFLQRRIAENRSRGVLPLASWEGKYYVAEVKQREIPSYFPTLIAVA
jgi:hypothetical protein